MDSKNKPEPCYAAVYAAALYPDLVGIFRESGYALAAHGSLRRDFDLVAIPWIENADDPTKVLERVTSEFAIRIVGNPQQKLHGRVAWTISIGHGHCAIDLSFMPRCTGQ